MVFKRRLDLQTKKSYLLLGPRRVGKSTYLRTHFESSEVEWIDLLQTDLFYEYRARPALLRERFAGSRKTLVIDEIQLIPDLIREVHGMIETHRQRFVLSGSSARALRKQGISNLAGRLLPARLHPLTALEMPQFDLKERLQYGSIPPIVFSDNPNQDLKAYCGEYLKEEIQAESLVRNLPAFSRFLELAALSNSEQISFATVARDCGIANKTAKDYFEILQDTLLAHLLDPWTRTKKRRPILTQKFYFFDCGLPNFLLNRKLSEKTPEFGKSFEQFLVLEAIAARDYENHFEQLHYWRSASGYEVDLLLDDHTACEFKTGNVTAADARGLVALSEDMKLKNRWIISLDQRPRKLDNGVLVLPWRDFLQRIQAGDF